MIKEATGVTVSASTICRILKKNGFTRKKVQNVAKQRSIEYRAQFRAHSMLYRMDQFVWVDETGSDCRQAMKKFGYSLLGLPPVCHKLLVRGTRISAISAICSDGLIDTELVTGSVNGRRFVDFLRGTLIPNMNPFDDSSPCSIMILDNCSIHHVSEVSELAEQAGILVMYLPPYSPDLNPIEATFSSVKYYLQEHEDLVEDPKVIIQAAFNSITNEKSLGWIKDCGYI